MGRDPDPMIPRYSLYDEPARAVAPGFIHVETIASRSAPRDWTIRSHAHRDLHQMLLVAAGGGEMRAEAETWRFGADSLLLVPAGLVHAFRFEPGTHGHVVSFADPLLRAVVQAPALTRLFASARMGVAGSAIEPLIAALAAETDAPAALAATAAEAWLKLLLVAAARALDDGLSSAAPGRSAALVERFRRQIEARIGQGWSVARHAAALGVSASALRAACAEAAGDAPIRLIRQRALIEARRMLVHGAAPVASVGYALGFTDPAYFSRWFARAEGCPPAAYRTRTRG